MESDAELLGRSPDPDAVEAFYRRHVDTVMRFAVRRCAGPEDVADLVSITFLEAIGAARTYDAKRGPARPWLLGIAARCLADHLRDSLPPRGGLPAPRRPPGASRPTRPSASRA